MGAALKPKNSNRVLCEINVTPFVDVMLVLLVIFMVTSPMMQQGLKVDLPEAKNTGKKAIAKKARRWAAKETAKKNLSKSRLAKAFIVF